MAAGCEADMGEAARRSIRAQGPFTVLTLLNLLRLMRAQTAWGSTPAEANAGAMSGPFSNRRPTASIASLQHQGRQHCLVTGQQTVNPPSNPGRSSPESSGHACVAKRPKVDGGGRPPRRLPVVRHGIEVAVGSRVVSSARLAPNGCG